MSPVKLVVKSPRNGSHRWSNMMLIIYLCPMTIWQPLCDHFPGTDAYTFSVYFSYTQTKLTFVAQKQGNKEK